MVLREEVDHRRGRLETALQVGLAPRGSVEVDVDPGLRRAGLDFGEVATDQRHEVGRVRDLESVVPEHPSVAEIPAFAQVAVRKREHAGGHLAQDLAGRFHQRRVHAREVVARVLVLALRPALERAAGMGLVRADEVEAAHRRALVGDGDRELVAPLVGPVELDAQAFAVVARARRRLLADRHVADDHVDGVQLDRRQVVTPAAQGKRHVAAQLAPRQVRFELEAEVRDADRAIGGEVGRGAGGGERSWHDPGGSYPVSYAPASRSAEAAGVGARGWGGAWQNRTRSARRFPGRPRA